MSSDGKFSGAVKSAVISSDAMKCKEWPRSWSLQDLLYLDGNEFINRWKCEEFWVGFILRMKSNGKGTIWKSIFQTIANG